MHAHAQVKLVPIVWGAHNTIIGWGPAIVFSHYLIIQHFKDYCMLFFSLSPSIGILMRAIPPTLIPQDQKRLRKFHLSVQTLV